MTGAVAALDPHHLLRRTNFEGHVLSGLLIHLQHDAAFGSCFESLA